MSLAKDIEFARESGEFLWRGQPRIAPMLRYVAAINPRATRKAFVKVAVRMGYHPNTAAKQFAESRKFDRIHYGIQVDAEGRQEGEG